MLLVPGALRLSWRSLRNCQHSSVRGWINVNARFSTHLTRLLLPLLVKHQPGLMLFANSGVTEMTVPGLSLYTGTKSYIEALARCLKLEMKMKGHDIEMKSLITGTVATASSGRSEKDVSFTMPTTQAFVKASLDKVGYNSSKITPWFGHFVQKRLLDIASNLATGYDDFTDVAPSTRADGQKEMKSKSPMSAAATCEIWIGPTPFGAFVSRIMNQYNLRMVF